MDLLDVDKLLSILSLAALGFVCRFFYRLQLGRPKEDPFEILLWSLVLSAILGIAFKAFGWPIKDSIVKHFTHLPQTGALDKKQLVIFATGMRSLEGAFNLGFSAALGFTLGRLQNCWVLSERPVDKNLLDKKVTPSKPKRAWLRLLTTIAGFVGGSLKLYDSFLMEFLDQHCRKEWVVVTFNDGTAVMGCFQFAKSGSDKEKSHLLLRYPGPFDAVSQIAGAPSSEYSMINLDEVRSIAVTSSKTT